MSTRVNLLIKLSTLWILVLSLPAFAATIRATPVYDFRNIPGRVELSAKEQAKILARVRKDLNLPDCEGGEVRQEITGYLTRKVQQIAYLVYNCRTYAAEPIRREFGRLAIYQDGKLVANFKDIGDEVKLLPDINGDGTNELVFIAAFGPHMGEFSENLSVIGLEGGKIRTFTDLDNALYDTCSGVGSENSTIAWRLSVEPATRPIFILDRYQTKCSQTGQYSRYIYQFSKRVLADTP